MKTMQEVSPLPMITQYSAPINSSVFFHYAGYTVYTENWVAAAPWYVYALFIVWLVLVVFGCLAGNYDSSDPNDTGRKNVS